MSDDTLNIDFGDVDFSKAKDLPQPQEGNYEFVIDDYKLKPTEKDPRCTNGVNVSLVLKFADPYDVRTDLEEEADFTNFKIYDNIYVHFENPFGSKPFFEAALGRDLSEEAVTAEEMKTVSNFIGERIGATIFKAPHWKDAKKTQWKVADNSKAYYAV